MPVVDGISKPAGVRCIQLSATLQCLIFGHPDRPAVCSSLKPDQDMCGGSREQAMHWLTQVETETAP